MTATDHDDLERDAWLCAALQHAPDADIAPPTAVSETILKQAQAAAPTARATVARPLSPSLWSAAWAWLGRPPVAAGFAGLMVATLVGLMWWDRPMDEALPRPPAPGFRGQASADAPPPTAESKVDTAPSPAAMSAPPAPPAAARRKATSAPAAAGHAQVPTEAAAPPMAATAPAAPAVADAPQAAAMPRQRMRDDSAADERAGVARDEASTSPASASGQLAARALAKAASPPVAMALPLRDSEATERLAPLAALRASIDAVPLRWSWQRGSSVQAMTPALQGWLARLDAATASRWRTAPSTAPEGEGSALRLYLGGALQATLRIDDGSVWFAPGDASAAAARATLATAALAALKQSLDEAAP